MSQKIVQRGREQHPWGYGSRLNRIYDLLYETKRKWQTFIDIQKLFDHLLFMDDAIIKYHTCFSFV